MIGRNLFVGEKVKISQKVKDEGFENGCLGTCPDMVQYAGKIVTISNMSSGDPVIYRIAEDRGRWSWDLSAFDKITIKKKKIGGKMVKTQYKLKISVCGFDENDKKTDDALRITLKVDDEARKLFDKVACKNEDITSYKGVPRYRVKSWFINTVSCSNYKEAFFLKKLVDEGEASFYVESPPRVDNFIAEMRMLFATMLETIRKSGDVTKEIIVNFSESA